MQNNWRRDELIIVLELYFRIPFKSSAKTNPEVIEVAKLIGRSPSAVNMKIGNFGSLDPTLLEKGTVGLTNRSKLDKTVWDEFYGRTDALVDAYDKIMEKYTGKGNTIYQSTMSTANYPTGEDVSVITRQRRHQDFFRSAVLASYHSVCCITKISSPRLLIASHIKPWKDSTPQERTDPQNGVCLNALHDRALDQGLLTITPDYTIRISDVLREEYIDEEELKIFTEHFGKYEDQKINFPERLLPKREYLDYHHQMIFKK